MLYPTLNQPLMLLVIFSAGIICGVLFDVLNIFSKYKILKHIADFFGTILSFLLLFAINLKFNYGQFRIYIIAVFALSFAIEKIISYFLWTKLIKKCYIRIRRKN